MDYDHLFDQTVNARNAFWENIGTVDSDVLTHLINPTLTGDFGWTFVGQAFVKIETPNTVILASDGLSDPFSMSLTKDFRWSVTLNRMILHCAKALLSLYTRGNFNCCTMWYKTSWLMGA